MCIFVYNPSYVVFYDHFCKELIKQIYLFVSMLFVSASVIGTRLHVPVALTCVLMGLYVWL